MDYTDKDINNDNSNDPLNDPLVERTYSGLFSSEKRYMCVGFDDWRDSDFSVYLPLFEKYGFKATFNQIRYTTTPSDKEKERMFLLIAGGHELGDHTWMHQQFPFTEPLFNGQDPARPEGKQVPYPTNDQMRNDCGKGKNVFGMDLLTPVSDIISYDGPPINTPWGKLSDDECQVIRNWFSVMKDTNTNLIDLLDSLSNTYLGTQGRSNGSWDDIDEEYKGGIFTGCKTSANHEIWERILQVTDYYYKNFYNLNYKIITWSLPGSKVSKCYYLNPEDGFAYYDTCYTKLVNYMAKFESSIYNNPDGSSKIRSWVDCLREYGYKATHGTLYPGYRDRTERHLMQYQFVYNAKGRRKDALPYSSTMTTNISDQSIRDAFPESFFSEGKSFAAQMYDSNRSGVFRRFIENARRNMSNGIVDIETIDSEDNYSMRLFFEGLLQYCATTGVELITKDEAFDLCFNHDLERGNLLYNSKLRNTAKEFMPDASCIPDNPDGYEGECNVTFGDDGNPVLNTIGIVRYKHFGIPNGTLSFSAKVKGSGTITIKELKNNSNSDYSGLTEISSLSFNNEVYSDVSTSFTIDNMPPSEYEQLFEGYGDIIIGVLIEYSKGLSIKDIKMEKL